MIIRCKSGAQIVVGECPWVPGAYLSVGECPWVPGAYLSVGNVKGSIGAVIDPRALDRVIAELGRIAAMLAAGADKKLHRRQRRRTG